MTRAISVLRSKTLIASPTLDAVCGSCPRFCKRFTRMRAETGSSSTIRR